MPPYWTRHGRCIMMDQFTNHMIRMHLVMEITGVQITVVQLYIRSCSTKAMHSALAVWKLQSKWPCESQRKTGWCPLKIAGCEGEERGCLRDHIMICWCLMSDQIAGRSSRHSEHGAALLRNLPPVCQLGLSLISAKKQMMSGARPITPAQCNV